MATVTELRPFNVNKQPVNPTSVSIITAKQTLSTEEIMKEVEVFFSKAEHMGKLLPFLHGTSKISLRMVEWFVFVYAMQHTIDWFIGDEYFNVYLDYQAHMAADNTKMTFDPMGRKWRKEKRKDKSTVRVYHGINFYYTDTDYVVTCVAQLNFFRWFIGKGILDYMVSNYDPLQIEFGKYYAKKKTDKAAKDAAKIAATTTKTPAPTLINNTGGDASNTKSTNTSSTTNAASKKTRIQAIKKVTKKHVEVYVSFD